MQVEDENAVSVEISNVQACVSLSTEGSGGPYRLVFFFLLSIYLTYDPFKIYELVGITYSSMKL